MDTAFISAFSALGGSVVGGLTAGMTTWLAHLSQTRAGHRLHNVTQRETLYRDFVVTASQAFASANISTEPQIPEIVGLFGLISRMRIISSAEVIASAEATVELIFDTYMAPPKTVLEIRTLMKSGNMVDPLKDFSEHARTELQLS